MNFKSILLLLAFSTSLLAQNNADAPAPPASEAAVALTPQQQAFLNLPEERRKEFIQLVNDANRIFQQKRIFETLENLEKAAKIFPDSPEVHNLRGSCYVEMRTFEKALAEFIKADQLAKDSASIKFNIGEVYFVTKDWRKSHDQFEKVLKLVPEKNTSLARLVEFKILLSKKKLGLDNEVTIMAEKYDFLDDSPFYYYAQAALAYDQKNLVVAEEWLARARRIFRDPAILAPWQDTLIEYGYIKSFYGEDLETEE